MRKSRLTLGVLFSLLVPTLPTGHAWAQVKCDFVFDLRPLAATKPESARRELAERMVERGLEPDAYVARWKAKTEAGRGPLAPKGDLLVVAVRHPNFDRWMAEVGERSIGLVLNGLPEHKPGTAYLRVGNRMFTYNQVRNEDGVLSFSKPAISPRDSLNPDAYYSQRGWTEATFAVTPAEMQAVLDFLLARSRGIKAVRDLPRSYREGETIRPEFDSEKFTLKQESCAAACTSWMDPKWLEHYKGPSKEVLLGLVERLDAKPTFVARQNIWANSRNENTLSLTLVGFDQTKKLDHEAPLIEVNKWFNLRGMQVFALIPDPVGTSKTVEADRMSLREWLASLPRRNR